MFYVVRALSPYTEYEFHVIGVNNIGRGPPSQTVSCFTGESGEMTFYFWFFGF
jgi:receptor-type tyrosine-protein phosphatase F